MRSRTINECAVTVILPSSAVVISDSFVHREEREHPVRGRVMAVAAGAQRQCATQRQQERLLVTV